MHNYKSLVTYNYFAAGWVLDVPSGCGHCTCMAGTSETCSYKRWSSSLLVGDTYSYERSDTMHLKGTHKAQLVKDIPYLMLKDIDFTSAKKKIKCTHEGEGANN